MTPEEALATSTLLGFLSPGGERRFELRRQADGAALILIRDAKGVVPRTQLTFDRTELSALIQMLEAALPATPAANVLARRRRAG